MPITYRFLVCFSCFIRLVAYHAWCRAWRPRHVLPHQTFRTSPLFADRREPLGRRPLPATRRCYPRPTRSPPARRPLGKPPRLGGTLCPASPVAVRSGKRTARGRLPTTLRPRRHLRTPLAGNRLRRGPPPSPSPAPLRIRRRTGGVPHGAASPA